MGLDADPAISGGAEASRETNFVSDWNPDFQRHLKLRRIAVDDIIKRSAKVTEQLGMAPDEPINPSHWRAMVTANDHIITLTAHYYAGIGAQCRGDSSALHTLLPMGVCDFDIFDERGANVRIQLSCDDSVERPLMRVNASSSIPHLTDTLYRQLNGPLVDANTAFKLVRMAAFEIAVG